MSDKAQKFQESLAELIANSEELAMELVSKSADTTPAYTEPFFITGLTVFVLACFVGYHVVWRVTPALHSPLMGITNAISSVIIVGAVFATGTFSESGISSFMGFLAVTLASVNIFGGFVITQRMLHMFKKK